jgi:Protein of unknown function (DUF2917)
MTTFSLRYRSLGTVESWSARKDETRRLPPGREGLTIRVEEGQVLVTQAGRIEDHLLGPGQSLRLDGHGLGVAWALTSSRAVITRGGARALPRSPPAGRPRAA